MDAAPSLDSKDMLSSDSSSSIKQSFEQQIEKELEIHLDSINSFKEKLLNFTNEAKTSLKRKNDNSNPVAVDLINQKEVAYAANNVDNEAKKKNKKKKKKKLLPTHNNMQDRMQQQQQQQHTTADVSSLKQLKLEQDQLEKQLIEQQKLQQMQIEQLQKQIDEFVEAETCVSAKNRLASNSQGMNEHELSQVLSDLSEALKTNSATGKFKHIITNNLKPKYAWKFLRLVKKS